MSVTISVMSGSSQGEFPSWAKFSSCNILGQKRPRSWREDENALCSKRARTETKSSLRKASPAFDSPTSIFHDFFPWSLSSSDPDNSSIRQGMMEAAANDTKHAFIHEKMEMTSVRPKYRTMATLRKIEYMDFFSLVDNFPLTCLGHRPLLNHLFALSAARKETENSIKLETTGTSPASNTNGSCVLVERLIEDVGDCFAPPADTAEFLKEIPRPLTQAFLDAECRSISSSSGEHTRDQSQTTRTWSYQDRIFIKYGPRVRESEALTLRALGESCLGVPVPRLYDCYRHPETGYWCILMQYVRGCRTLVEATEESGSQVLDGATTQLTNIVSEIRAWRKSTGIGSLASNTFAISDTVNDPTIGIIPSCLLGPVYDHFFESNHMIHGPFAGLDAHRDFSEDLADAIHDRAIHAYHLDVVRDVLSLIENDYPSHQQSLAEPEQEYFVFTHGDISPQHILVDERTDAVRCIVGWSRAGFFPGYWEYAKAQFRNYENCLLGKEINLSASSSVQSTIDSIQNWQEDNCIFPERVTGRIDDIFAPDRTTRRRAAIILAARDVIF